MGNNPIPPLILEDGLGGVVAVVDQTDAVVARLKRRYVLGEFSLEEFEHRLDEIYFGKRDHASQPPTVVR